LALYLRSFIRTDSNKKQQQGKKGTMKKTISKELLGGRVASGETGKGGGRRVNERAAGTALHGAGSYDAVHFEVAKRAKHSLPAFQRQACD